MSGSELDKEYPTLNFESDEDAVKDVTILFHGGRDDGEGDDLEDFTTRVS